MKLDWAPYIYPLPISLINHFCSPETNFFTIFHFGTLFSLTPLSLSLSLSLSYTHKIHSFSQQPYWSVTFNKLDFLFSSNNFLMYLLECNIILAGFVGVLDPIYIYIYIGSCRRKPLDFVYKSFFGCLL